MSPYQREWFVYPEDADELSSRSRLRLGLTAYGGNPLRFLVQFADPVEDAEPVG